MLGTGAEHDVVYCQFQAPALEPQRSLHPRPQQVRGTQITLQADCLAASQQARQCLRIALADVINGRDIGSQIDPGSLLVDLLQTKQGRLLTARQHIGPAPDFTRYQMPARSLAVSLHGGAGVPAQGPGQPPLRWQARPRLEIATGNGPGNGLHQRQIARLRGFAEVRYPHLLLAMQYKGRPIQCRAPRIESNPWMTVRHV